jgi:hypothetical protein
MHRPGCRKIRWSALFRLVRSVYLSDCSVFVLEPAIGLEPMTCRLRTICQPCRSPLHRAKWALIVRDRFTRPVTVSLNGPSFAEKMHGAFFWGPQHAPLRGSPTGQELSTASARAAGSQRSRRSQDLTDGWMRSEAMPRPEIVAPEARWYGRASRRALRIAIGIGGRRRHPCCPQIFWLRPSVVTHTLD